MTEVALPTAKRLRFRKLEPSDRRLLDRELNVPEVIKYLGEDPKLFHWLLKEQQGPYGHTFWPIELKETGEFVGICGLVTVDEEDSTVLGATELGYRIKPSAKKKGYATEASVACLQHAFEHEEAWWVVSRTTIENVPSWSLMKKLGMRHDPRLDYSIGDKAFVVHVMTSSEWRSKGRTRCREILSSVATRVG